MTRKERNEQRLLRAAQQRMAVAREARTCERQAKENARRIAPLIAKQKAERARKLELDVNRVTRYAATRGVTAADVVRILPCCHNYAGRLLAEMRDRGIFITRRESLAKGGGVNVHVLAEKPDILPKTPESIRDAWLYGA